VIISGKNINLEARNERSAEGEEKIFGRRPWLCLCHMTRGNKHTEYCVCFFINLLPSPWFWVTSDHRKNTS